MIASAKFITSSTNLSQSPSFALSEVAFLGRSNVGKSSLINALVRQKNLAKSSSTPGKTKLINFFEVSFKSVEFRAFAGYENSSDLSQMQKDKKQKAEFKGENSSDLAQIQKAEFKDKFSLIFVDLPGFGYAKVSRTQREEWDKNLDEFLKKRETIKLFIHLIDSRHENLSTDESIAKYLQSVLAPTQRILKVFTKADKLNQSQKARLKSAFGDALLVSSTTRQGLDELEKMIITQSLGL